MFTEPALTYDPHTRALTGPNGRIVLAPGPALLVARLLAAPSKLVPHADLLAALDLPPSVRGEEAAVLRAHLKTIRVLAAALSGGAWSLQMRGQDSIGLGPVPASNRASATKRVYSGVGMA